MLHVYKVYIEITGTGYGNVSIRFQRSMNRAQIPSVQGKEVFSSSRFPSTHG